MNSDSETLAPDERITEYVYDTDNRIVLVRHSTKDNNMITYMYDSQPNQFKFEHDKQKRLFILTGGDGKAEHFRDNPARYLMVEPDPKTGEMRPVTLGGMPTYFYLCREEREI